MNFNRRDLLKAGAAVSLAIGLPRQVLAQAFAPQPGAWREFQVVTRLEVANTKGRTQAWIPVPSVNEKDWFKSSQSMDDQRQSGSRIPNTPPGLVVEWPTRKPHL